MLRIFGISILVTGLAASVAAGCGSQTAKAAASEVTTDTSTTQPGFGGANGGGGAAGPCTGLRCQQRDCGGRETTVTGRVFAPNGTLPLYNAIVYVPNAQPVALPRGVTCDVCGAVTGDPIVTALSQPDGSFRLERVPVGKDIPLVIQVGKWRRKVVIPEVKACEETTLTDPDLTRLPRTQSEGDMPRIALTTGGCDTLGCMLPKIGIDPSELGTEADGPSKVVHVYTGQGGKGPAGARDARSLWTDPSKLSMYDMAILSCECDETPENKGDQAFAAMTEYLKAGGRIFTTDYMYTWYRNATDASLRSIGTIPGGAPHGDRPVQLDTSFPKGRALADWLDRIAPGSNGQVQADAVFANISSLDPRKVQTWATSGRGPNTSPEPRVFTVNVPVDAPPERQCGKGVHIDAHVNGVTKEEVDETYPQRCSSKLKDAEALLAFFFFDLASCIQNESAPPKPPVVK